jgi:hypothetical protein
MLEEAAVQRAAEEARLAESRAANEASLAELRVADEARVAGMALMESRLASLKAQEETAEARREKEAAERGKGMLRGTR